MRFLLGAAEAGFFPGAIYYISQWFPASYRGRAISRFYVAFPISSVVMGALAGFLLNLQGRAGLAGWQWLFLIEGTPAVIMGIVFWMLLPDKPSDASWLTVDEQRWIVHHVVPDAHRSAVKNTLRALRDPQVLRHGIANLFIMSAGYAGLLSAPTVLQDVTKWTPFGIGFLVACSWTLGAVVMLLVGWHSDRRQERYIHTILSLVILGIGYLGMGVSHSTLSISATYAVTVVGQTAVQTAFWCIPGDEFVGPLAQVGVAAIGSIGMIGAFLGPYAFGIAKDYSGTYEIGLLLAGVLYFAGAAVVLQSRRSARASVNAGIALEMA
jgi:ACS family tartrate transporter-like MFS transporter